MSNYSSLLFGTDKHHRIGPFRLPIYNYLVPGEAKGLELATKRFARTQLLSLQLVSRLAKDKSITTTEAEEILKNASDPENKDIVYQYAEELAALQEAEASPTAERIAYATVLLRYRAEIEKDGIWKSIADWTEEDTERVPPAILNELFTFLTWERDGWPEGKLQITENEASDQPQRKQPRLGKTSSQQS